MAGISPEKAASAAEALMFTTMALINILLVNIILVLVLVGVVRKKNSAFGHVHKQDAISVPC